MATYKEIFGTNIEVLASDPANPVQGQVWYNSTSNVVKGLAATTVGAWATGNNMNTARRVEGTGTQTAALGFGGVFSALTESYNGTSWTEVNDLNTARYEIGPAGTQTSALGFSGATPPAVAVTESWNGTSWTEVNDLNTARSDPGGAGTNTAALGFGGLTGGPPYVRQALTESWNGTSWSEDADLSTARNALSGNGATNTAALALGGETPSITAATEEWTGAGSPTTKTITTS